MVLSGLYWLVMSADQAGDLLPHSDFRPRCQLMIEFDRVLGETTNDCRA